MPPVTAKGRATFRRAPSEKRGVRKLFRRRHLGAGTVVRFTSLLSGFVGNATAQRSSAPQKLRTFAVRSAPLFVNARDWRATALPPIPGISRSGTPNGARFRDRLYLVHRVSVFHDRP